MSERYDLNRLRAAFAEPDDPPHPESCPSPSEIWDGVHGKLPPGHLRDIVEHLASCSPCAEAWRVALMLERPAAAGDMPAEEAPAAQLARRPRWRLYGGLAAAAAALFAVVIGSHDSRRASAPVQIAQRGGTVAQETAVRWLTPSEAALPRSGARLRWSGPPGASYDVAVDLVDDRGEAKPISIAAPRSLAATEYVLAPRDLARAPAGALLHAALTAHLADGRTETIFRDFRLQ